MKFEQTITEPVDIHYDFIDNSAKLPIKTKFVKR